MIPCEEQSSNLFPLVGQEPEQGTQMDRGVVEVEEEAGESEKCASPPRQREREEHEVTRARRVWQDVRQKIPTSAQQLNRQCHGLQIPRT